jgi:hypothetical protein
VVPAQTAISANLVESLEGFITTHFIETVRSWMKYHKWTIEEEIVLNYMRDSMFQIAHNALDLPVYVPTWSDKSPKSTAVKPKTGKASVSSIQPKPVTADDEGADSEEIETPKKADDELDANYLESLAKNAESPPEADQAIPESTDLSEPESTTEPDGAA